MAVGDGWWGLGAGWVEERADDEGREAEEDGEDSDSKDGCFPSVVAPAESVEERDA